MSLSMQEKLLRMIQEREVHRLGSTRANPVNVRLIPAMHRNLHDELAADRFRQELYYRFNFFGLQLPDSKNAIFQL